MTFSSPDDAYFTNTTAAFTEAFAEAGGEVVQDFSFGLADEDFSSQVNELAGLDPVPDVLYTAMIMPGAGVLLEQLDAAGLGDIQVIGADSFDATVVWSAGDVANGVAFTAHTFPRDDNGVQAFLDEAADAGADIETVSFGALASDVVKVFAHAAETACSLDGPTLIETIAGITDLEVTTGRVTYAGTNGVPQKDVVILTVEGRRADVHRGLPAVLRAVTSCSRVEALTTRYGGIVALDGVTLHVDAGELVALVGPNGAGKSTLLNTVAGLVRPADGRVRLAASTSPVPSRPPSSGPGWPWCPSAGGSSVTSPSARTCSWPASRPPGRPPPAAGRGARPVRRCSTTAGTRPPATCRAARPSSWRSAGR